MPHALPELPYAMDALAPRLSRETLEYHYGKHHPAHVKALNAALAGSEMDDASLATIVREAALDSDVFRQASLCHAHDLYWRSMSPVATAPDARLTAAIEGAFGSLDQLGERFAAAADEVFASGWAWLVQDRAGALAVLAGGAADNPLRDGMNPLLACDLWEHAYYVDYRNARRKYVAAFWELANWKLASERFATA